MMPDGEGNGGASEGDIRGNSSDLFEGAGVVDVAGGHLLVQESSVPAMNVLVDVGVGYVPNTAFDETDSDSIKFWECVVAGVNGERTLTIDANSSGQTRFDLICLTIDPGASPDYYASDVAELIVVKGTPGAGVPATPAYHLALAEVTVVNGATEIENADINDVRVQVEIKDALISSTLTGKRMVKRVTSVSTGTSVTPNIDDYDEVANNNTASAGTYTINNPTGTPTEGQVLIVRLKSTNAQTYAFGNKYRAGDNLPLPDTHDGGAGTDYLGFLYNATDDKWDLLALLQGF